MVCRHTKGGQCGTNIEECSWILPLGCLGLQSNEVDRSDSRPVLPQPESEYKKSRVPTTFNVDGWPSLYLDLKAGHARALKKSWSVVERTGVCPHYPGLFPCISVYRVWLCGRWVCRDFPEQELEHFPATWRGQGDIGKGLSVTPKGTLSRSRTANDGSNSEPDIPNGKATVTLSVDAHLNRPWKATRIHSFGDSVTRELMLLQSFSRDTRHNETHGMPEDSLEPG